MEERSSDEDRKLVQFKWRTILESVVVHDSETGVVRQEMGVGLSLLVVWVTERMNLVRPKCGHEFYCRCEDWPRDLVVEGL